MFIPEAQVLIAAHKYTGAQDIMNRYRYGYENLPDFIRAGVHSYNRNTIEFDNAVAYRTRLPPKIQEGVNPYLWYIATNSLLSNLQKKPKNFGLH